MGIVVNKFIAAICSILLVILGFIIATGNTDNYSSGIGLLMMATGLFIMFVIWFYNLRHRS